MSTWWIGIFLIAPASTAESASSGWVDFRDETEGRLVADPVVGAADRDQKSFAWADFDRDGDVDLICVRKQMRIPHDGRRNVLLMNEGRREGRATDGILVDRTSEFGSLSTDGGNGLMDAAPSRDVVAVDVDNDGWIDIVTATWSTGQASASIAFPRIYRNLGMIRDRWGGFVHEHQRLPRELTDGEGRFGTPRFSSVAAGDVDGDGFADLFFANDDGPATPNIDLGNRFFVNDATGFYRDATVEILPEALRNSSSAYASELVDLTGDGRLDLLLCDSFPKNRVILGIGPGEAVAIESAHSIYEGSPHHVATADFNLDGVRDVAVIDDGPDVILQGASVAATWAAARTAILLSDVQPDGGAAGNALPADLDGDGFMDLIIADVDDRNPSCHGRLRLFRNLGRTDRVEMQEQADGADMFADGVHDAAAVDLNGDGLLDLVVGGCQGTRIWMQTQQRAAKLLFPGGLPVLVDPRRQHPFAMAFAGVPGAPNSVVSATMHLSIDGSTFLPLPLPVMAASNFRAILPPSACGTRFRWYVTVRLADGTEIIEPALAPQAAYHTTAGAAYQETMHDDLDHAPTQWRVSSFDVAFGGWEHGSPTATDHHGVLASPGDGASPGVGDAAFFTGIGPPGLEANLSDLDGGPTRLTSPRIGAAGADAVISWRQWLYCSSLPGTKEADELFVEVSNDDGQSWVRVARERESSLLWRQRSFRVGEFVSPTREIRVRFSVSDQPNNSVTEAGIDEFRVLSLICGNEPRGITRSQPPDGAIDARQPAPPSGVPATGWSEVTLHFDGDSREVDPGEIRITQDPNSGDAPRILSTTAISSDALLVVLNRPLSPGRWTRLEHIPSGHSVRLGFLPGDVNADRRSSALDILALIDQLNGVLTPRPMSSVDVDRSGAANALDLLRLIDLLNGAASYESWNGRSLP